MGRRNLERLREWIAVCRLPHPSFWYGAFGLMWLCVGHSPRLLSFICLPRFSPCLTLLPPRCLSRLSDMVWVLDVVTCWKILTDGFHNDKKIHSPVGLKKEKKKVVRWVLFFGGGVAVTFQQVPALQKKKKILKKKKKISRSWDVSDLLRLFFFDEVCGRGLSQILVFKEVCKLNQSYFAHILYIIVR